MARSFPLRTSRYGTWVIRALAPGRLRASVADDAVTVSVGLIGRARVPLAMIESTGTMTWPWWGGIGVRLSKNLVVFIASGGEAALLNLSDSLRVRAPLPWHTPRVAIGVADVPGFLAAIADARRAAGLPELSAEPEGASARR